ncbi:MAG: HAMP domain-containing histidine kinase [Lachnospiraceae bacterium]|nr:HAMP domain-containing histidine kinase [Lachnospiraceae bacterium]
MSLKKRLIVTFLLLLILPLAMTFLLAFISRQTLDEGRFGIMPEGMVQLTVFQAVVTLVLIITTTGLVLVIWLYRSIIRPLNLLTVATNKIKDGDLDFSLPTEPESTDELEQLCEDFEEMRIQLKKQIDARLQYEKDTIELISNISHDLKTPLTAIKGYTEGILDGVADTPEKQNKYLKTIYTKASDMAVLVDELSFFSKIDTNIVPYNFKIFCADDFFDDCVEEMSLDTEVKNVTLDYISKLTAGQRIIADLEQLRRVMNNLIGNSVKYMDKESGSIVILSEDIGDFVKISVQDNGRGIEEKDIPYIFDRFYRADSSRNSKKGGSGLGLAITKKIVEDHGGTIDVRSIPGKGTCISFTLLKEGSPNAALELGEISDTDYGKKRWPWSENKMHLKPKE